MRGEGHSGVIWLDDWVLFRLFMFCFVLVNWDACGKAGRRNVLYKTLKKFCFSIRKTSITSDTIIETKSETKRTKFFQNVVC